jgi:hypothetical protein
MKLDLVGNQKLGSFLFERPVVFDARAILFRMIRY